MNELEKRLFAKGYIKLQLGSYRVWISKKWHEMFVRRGLVRKNFYGQFMSNTATLAEFCKWLELYDKACHDRDYPKSEKMVNPAEMEEIRLQVI